MTPDKTFRLHTYKCEDALYERSLAKARRLRVPDGLTGVIRDFLERWTLGDQMTRFAVIAPGALDESEALELWRATLARSGHSEVGDPVVTRVADGSVVYDASGEPVLTLGDESGLAAWQVAGEVY